MFAKRRVAPKIENIVHDVEVRKRSVVIDLTADDEDPTPEKTIIDLTESKDETDIEMGDEEENQQTDGTETEEDDNGDEDNEDEESEDEEVPPIPDTFVPNNDVRHDDTSVLTTSTFTFSDINSCNSLSFN
jgi:hypothetical protein